MENQNASIQNQTSRIFNGSSLINNFTDYEDEIIAWVDSYVMGVFLPTSSFIGIVGNTLSCVVLFQLSKISSFYLYLAFLSLSDVAILITSGVANLLPLFEFYQIFDIINFGVVCSVNFVLTIIFSHLSSWITVAVTFDRYAAVCHPFNANKFNTKRCALAFICTIFLVIVASNIPLMLCLKWDDEDSSCVLPGFINDNCFGYFHYIDICSYALVPFCLICSLNTLTVRGICNAARWRRELAASNDHAGSSIPNKNDITLKLVTTLFTITAFFIVSFSPYVCVFVYGIIHIQSLYTASELSLVASTIVYMGLLLNHSLNFIMYGLSGKKFRDKFLEIYRCRRFVRKSRD